MPLMRTELDSDRYTARRVVQLYQAGKIHHESREAARGEVWRRGRTPAGEPVLVGVSNGDPFRLIYDVDVCTDTTDEEPSTSQARNQSRRAHELKSNGPPASDGPRQLLSPAHAPGVVPITGIKCPAVRAAVALAKLEAARRRASGGRAPPGRRYRSEIGGGTKVGE